MVKKLIGKWEARFMKKWKRIFAFLLTIILVFGNIQGLCYTAYAEDVYDVILDVGSIHYIESYSWVNDGVSSSNPSVATAVKDNSHSGQVKITALSVGDTVVSFSHWSGTYNYKVHVSEVSVTGVSLSPDTITLAVGHRTKAIVTFTPENATNRNITWDSSDPSVATVDSTTGVITGMKNGTTTITAITQDGGKKDSVTVKVSNAETTWVKDTSHNFIDGEKYVFVYDGYLFYEDNGAMSADAVTLSEDRIVAEVKNQLSAWTYSGTTKKFTSFAGETLNSLTGLNNLEYLEVNDNMVLKGTCAPENNPGWANAPHYISLENGKFVKKLDANGYSEHSYPMNYQFLVYRETPINSEFSAEFYIVDGIDEINTTEMIRVGVEKEALPTAVGMRYDTTWYNDEEWNEEYQGKAIAAISVNGKLYSGPKLSNLQLYPGMDSDVKYYLYQNDTVNVKAEFYFVDSVGVIHDEHYCNSLGSHFLGDVEKELNRKTTGNLLENPLEKFGLDEKNPIYTELQSENALDLLYEVRSSKEIVSGDNNHRRQWIYASVRSNANNYTSADTHLHVDTENPPQDLDAADASLLVNELDGECVVKFIFHKKLTIPIEYYYEEDGKNTTLIAKSYTSKENWTHICPPMYNANTIEIGTGEKQFDLEGVGTLPTEITRTELVNRRMEFYVGTTLVKTINGVYDRVELTDDEADAFVGSDVKLKIYYTKPATVTLNYYYLEINEDGTDKTVLQQTNTVVSDINNTITIPAYSNSDYSKYCMRLCDEEGTQLREIKGVPEQLQLIESGYNFKLNIYYVEAAKVTVEYYFLALNSDGQEQVQKLGNVIGTISTDSEYKVSIPDFTVASEYLDISKIHVNDPWLISTSRTALVDKYVRQYDANQNLVQTITGVPDEVTLSGTGKTFTLRVYFVKPAVLTGNLLQLPVTIRDFRGDGTLFEYDWDVNDPSRCYNLYGVEGAQHPNGEGSERTTGLVENKLVDGKIVYKEATVRYVAQALYAGIYNDNKFDRYTNIIGHIFDVIGRGRENSEIDAMGSMATVNAALRSDNEVTFEEIKDAYTAAYYLLSHMWADDGVAADNDSAHAHAYKEYNMVVNEVRAIQFQEYTDGVETYFEYNSNLYDTVLENGIIKNTSNPAPKTPFSDLYYHPIDGLGYGNVAQDENPLTSNRDKLDNYNYLFTTVGQGQFVYSAAKNLYFEFNGDDDVYLFIDGVLVVDNGGAHQIENASVKLNDINGTLLHLEEGKSYDFTFFHAERRSTGSNFQIRTNIEVMDSSVLTEKHAYQDKEDKIDGEIVDKGQAVVYGFEMINHGTNHVFHLSFEDESLGIRLYSKGAAKLCKLDGLADERSVQEGHATEIGQVLSNKILPGNIEITITELDESGALYYPNVVRYQFIQKQDKNEILGVWWPEHDEITKELVPDTTASPTGMQNYGQFKETRLKDKFKELYGREGTQDEYLALLQEVLLNGLEPTQRILIKRFNRTMGANETYTNRVNTFATNISDKKIVGTASFTVRTLDIENRIFVIDYGKPVKFTEEQIFTKEELKNTWLKLDVSTNDTPDWKKISDDPTFVGKFGTATLGEETQIIDGQEKTVKYFQYTPHKFMSASEAFKIGVETKHEDSEQGTYETLVKTITMMPASNVYYEDNFNAQVVSDDVKIITSTDTTYINQSGIVFQGNWEQVKTNDVGEDVKVENYEGNISQQEGKATVGDNPYGYDSNYDNVAAFSNDTAWRADVTSGGAAKVYFEFVGDGVDIYSRTNLQTAQVRVVLYQKQIDGSWKSLKLETIDTLYKMGDLYQVPVISYNRNNISSLKYGTYRVELIVARKKVATGEDTSYRGLFYLDGVRIYNPAGTSVETEVEYSKNNEANANYTEIRDILLATKEQDGTIQGTGAVYIDSMSVETEFDKNKPGEQIISSVSTYETYGPKNEVYLNDGKMEDDTVHTGAVAFSVVYKAGMTLQVGARAPENMEGTPKIQVTVTKNSDVSIMTEQKIEVRSTSDMYYRIDIPRGVNAGDMLTVTIINASGTDGTDVASGDNFIALSKLKQSFDSTVHAASAYTVSEETVEIATSSVRTFMLARRAMNIPKEDESTNENTSTQPETPEVDIIPPTVPGTVKQDEIVAEDTVKDSVDGSTVEMDNTDDSIVEQDDVEDVEEEIAETDSEDEEVVEKTPKKKGFFQMIWDFIKKILSIILDWLGL